MMGGEWPEQVWLDVRLDEDGNAMSKSDNDVNAEMQGPLTGVQAGLQSVSHPKGGLISAREERIFHFQRYAAEQTGAVSVTHANSRGSVMKWSEIC